MDNSLQPPPIPQPAIRINNHALVVPHSHALPPICIFTGRREDLVRLERKLYWHDPMIYLTVLAGVLIYALVAIAVRQTAIVHCYVSRQEWAKRKRWRAASLILGILLPVCIFIGALSAPPEFAIVLASIPIMIIAALVIYFWQVRLVYPRHINEQTVTIKGISKSIMLDIVNQQ